MEVCSSHPVGSGNRKGSFPHPSSSLPPFMWQLHHTALVWTLLPTKALYSLLICSSKIHSLGSSYAPDIVQSPGDGQWAATCDVALVTLKTSGLNSLAEKKRFQKDSCFFQTLRLLRTMDLKERGNSPGISCREMEKVHSEGSLSLKEILDSSLNLSKHLTDWSPNSDGPVVGRTTPWLELLRWTHPWPSI